MEDFDDFADDFFSEEAREEAQRFESMLDNHQSLFFDLNTIEEIFHFYRLNGDFEKGIRLLDFAISQHPHEDDLWFKRSGLLFDLGSYSEALQNIENALKVQPEFTPYLLHKAQILSSQGLSSQAIRLLKEVADNSDFPGEVYYQLGLIYHSIQSFPEAVEHYRKAIQISPTYEDALFEMAYCLEMDGKPEVAIEEYLKFLDDSPYSEAVWYNLGILFSKTGLHEKAIDAYDYALAIREDFSSALYNKGCSLSELGKFEEAILVFIDALQQDKTDTGILFSIADCYEQLEDYSTARFYYRKCVSFSPEMTDAIYGIGYTLEQENRHFEAIHYYRKVTGLDENNFDAWLSLAFCEYEVGNEQSAYDALKTAIRLNPSDLGMWIDWAQTLQAEGKTENARDMVQEAITLNPEYPELFYLFAGLSFNLGRSKEGMVYLENALLMDMSKFPFMFEQFPDLKKDSSILALIQQYQRK
jgi:tetratricopeptide (TPR) repeat protein